MLHDTRFLILEDMRRPLDNEFLRGFYKLNDMCVLRHWWTRVELADLHWWNLRR